ncbi:TetR/AcrR family transcriptional regulator [Veillonella seminalis]|uniref:TetR/AcrR family transcriptional regulator n=1 Tax=Veillonella seminalis TaxID=1502943 RepID=UPI0023F068B4|nr:TetR family transcriptional regulator [Veillonella seminalis]
MAESTKDKIINTTYRLMLNNDDISSITVRMIAAEADVNVALVNYHFKNKDTLFNEVINQILIRAKEFFFQF